MKTHNAAISAVVVLTLFLFSAVHAEEQETIFYADYGARGDGVTNDAEAIFKAHEAANKANLPVSAAPGAVYYIAAIDKTAEIMTDTDWKDAKFIIDDSQIGVNDRNKNIFCVKSGFSPQKLDSVKTLQKNQARLNITLPACSLMAVTDNSKKRFIRYGANQNDGTPQTEVFVVSQNGEIDPLTPIIWDYESISSITAFPMDAETLTIRGGYFTTVANQAESRYTYYARGIAVSRSNVVLDGLSHAVTGELDHGAPYGGFINISNCANVTVRNCHFSGHRFYKTIGNAKTSVSMGTYDISLGKACGITFKNCRQLNSIHDTALWGVLGTNFTKNVTLDDVEFSRYDAHMGVINLTIRNSSLGHQGINLIGGGNVLIEKSHIYGRCFINLRSDYGSTFEGDITIKQCEFTPRNGEKCDAILFVGENSGRHDFGYPCFMPRKITIDGLAIHDSNSANDKFGPRIFGNFNKEYTNDDYVEKYPYVKTEEVQIRDLVIDSGRPYRVSDNTQMFNHLRITSL